MTHNLNLFTDDHPKTTLHGLRFATPQLTQSSINKIENHFDYLLNHQYLPGYPPSLRPNTYLKTQAQAKSYYQTQKMYRVLGLLNRAASIYKNMGKTKTPNIQKKKNIKESISLLKKWVNTNKKGGEIPNCCHHSNKDTQCVRLKDGKIFKLPRRFSKEKCKNPKGFSMKSSCTPYKECY
jgi:hypothetical protein